MAKRVTNGGVAMQKCIVNCHTHTCKYWEKKKDGKGLSDAGVEGYCTKGEITITSSGCESFERGLAYYYNVVWNLLQNSNVITEYEISYTEKISLYMVMKTYNLGFCLSKHGTWSWLSLYALEDEKKAPLTYKEIVDRPINMEAFQMVINQFNNGELNAMAKEYEKREQASIINEEKNKEAIKATSNLPEEYRGKFGFLSPTGNFYPSDWGTHEALAFEILKVKGWEDEYYTWSAEKNKEAKEKHFRISRNAAGDYLVNVKHFILIHSPDNFSVYVTGENNPWITKAQKDFLYDYFLAEGNSKRAGEFMDY